MKRILFLFFSVLIQTVAPAQTIPGGKEFISNCQCKSYKITYPASDQYKIYFADSSGRPVALIEVAENYVVNVDSFYYDNSGRLIRMKQYNEEDPNELYSTREYTYTASGKPASYTMSHHGKTTQTIEYTWDEQDRPLRFTQTLYNEETGAESAKYKLSFKFINDSTAMLELKDFEVLMSGKRVYNSKGEITKECIHGKSENFVCTYDASGRLSYISKTKEPAGASRFFDQPYEGLAGMNTKVEYSYDTKGRITGVKTYKAEQPYEVKMVYQE